MVTYFRSLAGDSERTSWDAFLSDFSQAVAVANATHIFIEIGPRWELDILRSMARVGVEMCDRWDVVYGSKKLPNVLLHAGPPVTCNPTGMSGVAMTTHVLNSVAVPGALVFDPCCGKGMTARCAVRAGMRFAGVELNPKRATVTQAWLDRRAP